MSSRAVVPINGVVTEVISVFDANDAGVTGLLDAAFTKFLYKDGVANGATVTVTEIANGQYAVTFTPTSAGSWHLRVAQISTTQGNGNAYNLRGWQMTYQATTDGVLTLAAIWGFVIAATGWGGNTVLWAIRKIFAATAGATTGGKPNFVAAAPDQATAEITGAADANGNRTVTTYSA